MPAEWPVVVTALKDGATAAALVVGGIAGYYKYLRGRVFTPRLEVALTLRLITTETHVYTQATATLKNAGERKVDLNLPDSVLRIFEASDRGAPLADEPEWKMFAALGLSGDHEWIESRESVCESWLIDVTSLPNVDAFKAALTLVEQYKLTPKVTWSATAIVVREGAGSQERVTSPEVSNGLEPRQTV